jgi:hypothetical protein
MKKYFLFVIFISLFSLVQSQPVNSTVWNIEKAWVSYKFNADDYTPWNQLIIPASENWLIIQSKENNIDLYFTKKSYEILYKKLIYKDPTTDNKNGTIVFSATSKDGEYLKVQYEYFTNVNNQTYSDYIFFYPSFKLHLVAHKLKETKISSNKS